jgi:molecular chaperone GrpE
MTEQTEAQDVDEGPDGGREDRVAALEAELEQARDRALRALAEAENARRRAERDRADARDYAIAGFARDVLAVADALGRALEAAQGRDGPLSQGVAATAAALERALERHGVTQVDAPVGQPFDPEVHEVMCEVPPPAGSPVDAGAIVEVLEVGYRLRDRLLRPARVAVAGAAAAAPAQAPPGGQADDGAPPPPAGSQVDTEA